MKNENLLDLIDRLKFNCIAHEQRVMDETGLSPAEYHGIAAINPGEKINGSDVSRKLNLSPSRASRVIDKMVKNGYLERENDDIDRRICFITLAPKGVALKKKIDAFRLDCDKRIRKQLSSSEVEFFAGSIKKIIDVI